jgi:hypothetical protein
MEWVKDAYPMGPRSLYGGMEGYVLVSLDDVTIGLSFNSQPAKEYAKWVFDHEEKFKWHEPTDAVTKKIETFINLHPQLLRCVVQKQVQADAISENARSYAWFNAFCLPGFGENFKTNEQVKRLNRHGLLSIIHAFTLILSCP